MLFKQIYDESHKLEKEIQILREELKKYPKDTIISNKNGNYTKWYRYNGKDEKYIRKSERKTAEKLAVKKYLTYHLADLEREKKAADSYLKKIGDAGGKARRLLDDESSYRELLIPYFKPISDDLKDWEASEYEQCKEHPEHLIHKTFSGKIVRSKSETIIDTALFLNKIPYRYEAQLDLDGNIFYPDFTVRHPQTGEVFYWEHFGMMDDPIYAKKTFQKLEKYNAYGIVISVNLIATFENKDNPINSDIIERIIRHYFL